MKKTKKQKKQKAALATPEPVQAAPAEPVQAAPAEPVQAARPPLADLVEKARAAFDSTRRALADFAKAYADAVALYGPDAQDAFSEAFPTIGGATWARLRAVGAGDFPAAAMLASEAYVARLARLPVASRNRLMLLGRSFRVVDAETGREKTVPFTAVSSQQLDIALTPDGEYRSPEQQREYIASHMEEFRRRSASLPYRIENDRMILAHAGTIGRNELVAAVRAAGWLD